MMPTTWLSPSMTRSRHLHNALTSSTYGCSTAPVISHSRSLDFLFVNLMISALICGASVPVNFEVQESNIIKGLQMLKMKNIRKGENAVYTVRVG